MFIVSLSISMVPSISTKPPIFTPPLNNAFEAVTLPPKIRDELTEPLISALAVILPTKFNPSSALSVKAPAEVVKLEAAAASIDNAPAESISIVAPSKSKFAAELISISPAVVVRLEVAPASKEIPAVESTAIAPVSLSPPIVKAVPSIVIAPPASISIVLDGVIEIVVIPVSDTAPSPSNSQVPTSSPKDAPPLPFALKVVAASIVVVVVLFMATVVALSISTGPPLAEIEPLKNKSFHL